MTESQYVSTQVLMIFLRRLNIAREAATVVRLHTFHVYKPQNIKIIR